MSYGAVLYHWPLTVRYVPHHWGSLEEKFPCTVQGFPIFYLLALERMDLFGYVKDNYYNDAVQVEGDFIAQLTHVEK